MKLHYDKNSTPFILGYIFCAIIIVSVILCLITLKKEKPDVDRAMKDCSQCHKQRWPLRPPDLHVHVGSRRNTVHNLYLDLYILDKKLGDTCIRMRNV